MWFLLGCGVESVAIPYPQMVLSTTAVDFGEVAEGAEATASFTVRNDGYRIYEGTYLGFDMGLTGAEGEGPSVLGPDDDSYCAWWIASEVSCEGPRRQPKSDSGLPRDSHGGRPYDSGGSPPDPEPRCEDDGGPLVLGPGCSVPVHVALSPKSAGEFDAAVWIESTAAAREGNDMPEYTRDPRNFVQQVFVHGEVTDGAGLLTIEPTGHDFGQHYPDGLVDSVTATVSNPGAGPLTVASVDLSAGCGSVVATGLAAGSVLAAGASSSLELAFTPVDDYPLDCVVTIVGDSDDTAIHLVANETVTSEPPSVSFVAPLPGALVDPLADITVELALSDDILPPSLLDCELWSLAQSRFITSCAAADDSGTTSVILSAGTLDAGSDTLVARVADGLPPVVTASLPVAVLDAPAVDADGDAFDPGGTPPDCDDADASAYPGATELPDGLDNDCDSTIDEGTPIVDDDSDGYTPEGGDCDDTDAATSPGSPERADSADNDCDGTIDEGTSIYDDDGDGWSEMDNDCDDDDARTGPYATEVCDDGVDNDCDGLADGPDGCSGAEPEFIGAVEVTPDACEAGERVEHVARVRNLAAFEAGDDCSATEFDGESLRYQCPCPEVDRCDAKNFTRYFLMVDDVGHQAWGYSLVTAYGPGTDLDADYVIEAHGPCAPRDGTEGSCGLALGLAILAWRRHRRHPGPDKPAR